MIQKLKLQMQVMVAIGRGMRVFKERTRLTLAASTAYPCGIVVNRYLPQPAASSVSPA